MKKIIALLLILSLSVFMFISCKNKNNNDDNDENQGVTTPPDNENQIPETPETPDINQDSDGVDDEYMPDDGWTDY